jgi:hypothetical protein
MTTIEIIIIGSMVVCTIALLIIRRYLPSTKEIIKATTKIEPHKPYDWLIDAMEIIFKHKGPAERSIFLSRNKYSIDKYRSNPDFNEKFEAILDKYSNL